MGSAVIARRVQQDGKCDLVSANYRGGTVSVLLGNGNGTFAAKSDFGAGARPVTLVIADANADGLRGSIRDQSDRGQHRAWHRGHR